MRNKTSAALDRRADMDEAPARPRLRGGLAGWQARKVSALAARTPAGLTVAALAEAVNLSPSHFSRAFRMTFGESPRAWLAEQRMAAARTRLLGTDDTVEQIATGLGYRTSSQFCRAFRARVGQSPQAFRRA